jgi:hypothetical protein
MKCSCRLCGWIGDEEDLEPRTIYYEYEGEIVAETYNAGCPNCHDFDEIYQIEKRLYKV